MKLALTINVSIFVLSILSAIIIFFLPDSFFGNSSGSLINTSGLAQFYIIVVFILPIFILSLLASLSCAVYLYASLRIYLIGIIIVVIGAVILFLRRFLF